jgi:Mg-chelatase subunit ChlD
MEENTQANIEEIVRATPWARKRQIIIITLLLFLFVVVASGISYAVFYDKPTCFDGKQNGDETGVDCGGSCALICSGVAKEPIIQFARAFTSVRGFSAVARIENPNDLLVKEAKYTFKLYDSTGALIAERKGSTFIPKRKSIPIYEPNIDTKGVTPTKVFFSFDPGLAWEKSDYEEPRLVVEDEKLIGEKTVPKLLATLFNPGVREVDNIEVISVLYDDAGNAVNASKTIVKNINPNERASLIFTWPNPLPENIRVCAKPVDVSLIIDRSGSMEFLSKNPPQPLTDVKGAAAFFVKQLSDLDQASVVSFANEASNPIDIFLTNRFETVAKTIENIFIRTESLQNTNISDGLQRAYEELVSPRYRDGANRVAVLLTDGVATHPVKQGDQTYPEKVAVEVAKKMKSSGISIYTIGLGKDVNREFLMSVASRPEDAFFAPSTKELESIYKTIGTKICVKGTSRIEVYPLVPMK